MRAAKYLGDGVYAHVDHNGCVVLTTGNHEPHLADAVIYLDEEALAALRAWLAERDEEARR